MAPRRQPDPRPLTADDEELALAQPTLDPLEFDQAKAAVRRKMFGAPKEEVRVGRFVVIKRIGAGGMGVVYSAYDSELDRKVALKLIRSNPAPTQKAQRRLLREARAMAQLSHPNVVQVYDVGRHEGQIYIAMEYVDGQDLGAWLADPTPRELPEIVSTFLAAGRGLAAAHEAGFVHRDFKPANVLVANDGQVRVLDFGLAQAVEDPELASTNEAGDSASLVASRPDARAGTPAYMSPEQHLGKAVDARTDQFSFCIALHEALHGERPFDDSSLARLRICVTDGERRPPAHPRPIPESIQRVLRRGLATDPADRYPSMDALLVELADDPAARRRRTVFAAGFVVALAAAVGTTYAWRENQLQACSGAELRLEGVWDDARRAHVEGSLLATGLSLAPDTFARVETALDGYAQAWVGQHTEACRSTQVGEQSQEMLDLRMRCLDRRLRELGALVDVLGEANAEVVQGATEAASRLPRVEQCADLEALAAEVKPPADPAVALAVEEVRSTLAQATAHQEGGKYADALTLAEQAAATARSLDYPPVLAEASLQIGISQIELGAWGEAEDSISAAYWTALAAEHDRVAAAAATAMIRLMSERSRYDDGLDWVHHAQAVVNRVHPNGHEKARFLQNWGDLLHRQAKYRQAHDKLEQALAIQTELFGPDDPAIATVLHRLGKVAFRTGDYAQARAHFERSVAIQEHALGSTHPTLHRALTGLGAVLKVEHDYPGAQRVYARSVAISEAAFGPEHPAVAKGLNNLGNLSRRMGEFEEAKAFHERALRIREKAQGKDHTDVADSLSNLATVLDDLGEYEPARIHHERALAIRERVLEADHTDIADSLDNLGNIASAQGDFAAALDYHRRALTKREKTLGALHPNVGWSMVQLAGAQVATGAVDEALVQLDAAAAAFATRANPEGSMLAESGFVRAQALWAKGEDPEEAKRLAALAREGFAEAGAWRRADFERVDAWLRARP